MSKREVKIVEAAQHKALEIVVEIVRTRASLLRAYGRLLPPGAPSSTCECGECVGYDPVSWHAARELDRFADDMASISADET